MRTRRLLILMAAFVGGLLILAWLGQLLVRTISLDEIQRFRQEVRAFDAWWRYVRWTFIAGLFVYWREINTWLAAHNDWSGPHLQRVLDGRWMVLATLAFIELFFVLRIHEPLVDRWLP